MCSLQYLHYCLIWHELIVYLQVNDLKYYMFNFDGYFNYKKRRFRGSFNKVSAYKYEIATSIAYLISQRFYDLWFIFLTGDVQMVLTYILTMWEGPCWMKCCCTWILTVRLLFLEWYLSIINSTNQMVFITYFTLSPNAL